jgi:hypothetical protein
MKIIKYHVITIIFKLSLVINCYKYRHIGDCHLINPDILVAMQFLVRYVVRSFGDIRLYRVEQG